MPDKIQIAIKQQNSAFVKTLNRRLDNPLPPEMLDTKLEMHDAFQLARLILKTHRSLEISTTSQSSTAKQTAFERFMHWIRLKRKNRA